MITNILKRTIATAATALLSAVVAPAQSADVGFVDAKNATSKTTREFERLSDGSLRLRIPLADIPAGTKKVVMYTDVAAADKGENGYMVLTRGEIAKFKNDSGKHQGYRMVLPIFGMKRGDSALWYEIRGMRHECRPIIDVRNGRHFLGATWIIEESPMGAYEDLVADIHFIKGDAANYVGIAKAYRKKLLESGKVRPIRDRMKEKPWLEYIANSIPIRFQYHGGKSRERKDFTPENEPKINVYLDFKSAGKYADECKKIGIDKIAFCSAGWQSGGYDGRFPDLFPIPDELGGEAGLREMISHIKSIGYRIHAHTNSTDCYTCSRVWTPDMVAKNADGSLQRGHYWCGGNAYNFCAKYGWERFLPEQLKKVCELGFQAPHYIDVFSAVPPYPCADPKHFATREDMAKIQREIADYCIKIFGGFASEGGFDHIGGQLDYINYVSPRIKMWRTDKSAGKKSSFVKFVDGFVPFWEIVYHGIILSNPDRFTQNHTLGNIVTKNHNGTDSGDIRFVERDGVENPVAKLMLFEYGGRPIFYSCKLSDIPLIKKAFDEFLPVRHLQLEFIEDHKILSPDATLTVFSNGEKIVCNYGNSPFEFEGKKIAPLDYKLFK